MAMTKGEAVAVQDLLSWVLALDTFEIGPEECPGDEEIVRLIGVLADRSSVALGAGIRQGDAITAAMRMLGFEPAVVRPAAPAVEDVYLPDGDVMANTGGAT